MQLLTPSNQLVIQVCLHTGLRVSDVLLLEREQLKNRFWVTERKTGKRKCVGLPNVLIDAILRESMNEGGKKCKWAFPGRKPEKPRTRQAVWHDVKRAAKACRIPQNIAPHSFRKVYAAKLLQQYGNIEKVQRALNHGSLSVTMIYCCAAKLLDEQRLPKPMLPGKRIRS